MTTLTTHHLSVTRGKRRLCENLSLSLKPGDYWAILGPNGSGKTTLLHTLCGQQASTTGAIRLNNIPLSSHSPKQIAQSIGMLFQHTNPTFPQTVREYCLDARFPHHSFLTAAKHRHQDDLILQNSLKRLELLPLCDQPLQRLSGGEQRRAAIAALLVQSPAIFLLDEPANHLDIRHQMLTMSIFADESQQHAVMMAVHDINLAAHYCNKILMLFPDGKTLHGTRDEMLTTERLSQLYQHPIDVLRIGDQTYWQPQRTQLSKKESPWEYAS